MAGRPKSIDNTKVFDVAKPGKSKPMSTSRPVIVNHSMAVKDASVINTIPEVEKQLSAPSVSHKVITPIAKDDETPVPLAVKESDIPEEEPSQSVEAVEETATETTKEAPADTDTTKSQPQEETSHEEPVAEEVAPAEPEAVPAPALEPVQSDEASVDALAEASSKPKEELKKAEEAKRDAALQELIDSKKYVVPLAHDSSKASGHKGGLIMVLVGVLLIAVAYLLIDAKIIETSIDLPYHFFNQ